jgi:hypothetical protein
VLLRQGSPKLLRWGRISPPGITAFPHAPPRASSAQHSGAQNSAAQHSGPRIARPARATPLTSRTSHIAHLAHRTSHIAYCIFATTPSRRRSCCCHLIPVPLRLTTLSLSLSHLLGPSAQPRKRHPLALLSPP